MQFSGAASPHVPSLSTLPADVSATLLIERTPQVKLNVVATIAEQFERLGARFRRPTIFKIEALDLDGLRAVLDNVLRTTDNGSLLPSAQSLAPVIKPPTARQTMLPNAKTRRVHAGDPSYGAGATSGSLAKPDARGQGHKEGKDIGAGSITHHPRCPHLLDRHATADNKRANAASEKRAGSTPLPLLLSDSAYALLPIPFFLLPFA
ncbi:hypothetical protein B0H14DRAFT_3129173 [Mycena olivaceomarginata]|nr:hypothetical protein B0H14DRAFT_3129173 [Mycena olivaceomarginata]